MKNKNDINSAILFKTISKVVTDIEIELRGLAKKGIFFVPELHLAFEIGKALFSSREEVFGKDNIEWLRETNLGHGGPSDLIFQSGESYYVFEFKISSTSDSYQKDIEKLQRLSLDSNFNGRLFFVALVDSFPSKKDARIDYLENLEQAETRRTTIETNYSRYSGKVNCELFLCELNN